MRVVVWRGLQPVVLDGVTLVLAESDAGTPLSVTSEFNPGPPAAFTTRHCGEAGFDTLLKNLALDRTVVVTPARGPSLADMGL